MRTQATDWEKIFAKDTSDTGQLPKIYEEFSKLNSKETSYLVKTWAKASKGNSQKISGSTEVDEKMLPVVCHRGNANENSDEIRVHTYQNGQSPKH